MTAPSLSELSERLRQLPAMPAVALDVIHSMAGQEVDLDNLARRISQDQAIAARVLRVANSPFYGLQKQVASIHDAIVVLGFSSVRSLVLAAALITSLPCGNIVSFSRDAFWRHSLATAVAAEALARALRHPPELLFVTGVLHDIGRLAMVSFYPGVFTAMQARATAEDVLLGLLERQYFGFDHAEAGARLATQWNFPTAIVEAIGLHHTPAQASGNRLVTLIHYADAIARALELDGEPEGHVPHLDQASIDSLGLGWDQLNLVLAETERRFESCRLMLS